MKLFFKALRICACFIITVSLVMSFASCKSKLEDEYEGRLALLLHEQQRLNNEREKILLGIENSFATPAYMSLLFVNLDPSIYTEAFPIMSEQDDGDVAIVGVMALSEDELPGLDGKLTLSQYNTLIDMGWGSALYWNGEGELDSFITGMELTLNAMEIELPKSIVFAYGTYSSECDGVLLAHGIENAVHSGEESLSYVDKSVPDGIWHPGRIGWRCVGVGANSSTRLKERVELEGGYAMFEIGFDTSADKYETTFFPVDGNDQDADRVDKFRSMISSFKQSVINGKITVYSIENTRDAVSDYYEARKNAEKENALRLQEIDIELDEIRRKLTDLYNEYH